MPHRTRQFLGFILFFFAFLFSYPKIHAFGPQTHWIFYENLSLNDPHLFSLAYTNDQENSQGLGIGFHYNINTDEASTKSFPYIRGAVFWDEAPYHNNNFDQQLSFNLEWHQDDWSFHTNAYLPQASTYQTQRGITETFAGLDGYQLGFLQFHHQPSQSATPGIDLRLARWRSIGQNLNLRTEVARYAYILPDNTVAFGRAMGAELSWTPMDQDWLINFSFQARQDAIKDYEMVAGVQISIPLGTPPKKPANRPDPWGQHYIFVEAMQTETYNKKAVTTQRPILRQYGVERYDHIVTTYHFSPAINPLTGRPYGKVIFVDQKGRGNGTESSPTSLAQAMTLADDEGIIVMDGRNGAIQSSQPISIGTYAMIVGGGYRLPIQDIYGRHGVATLGQKARPIFIDQPEQPALTLKGYAQAHLIDITGGSVGIHIQDGQRICLSDVEVGGTKAAGMVIAPSETIILKNCRIRHTTTEGLIAKGVNNLDIETMTIAHTGQTGLHVQNSDNLQLRNVKVQGSFADGVNLAHNHDVNLDQLSIDQSWGHGLIIKDNEKVQASQIHLHNSGGHGLWLKGSMAQSQWDDSTQIDYARQNGLHIDLNNGEHRFDQVIINESCAAAVHCTPETTPDMFNIKNLTIKTKQGLGLQIAENVQNVQIDRGHINQQTWTDYRFKGSTPTPSSICVTTHQPPHPNSYLYETSPNSKQEYFAKPNTNVFDETTWKSNQKHFFQSETSNLSSNFFQK